MPVHGDQVGTLAGPAEGGGEGNPPGQVWTDEGMISETPARGGGLRTLTRDRRTFSFCALRVGASRSLLFFGMIIARILQGIRRAI